LIAKLYFNTITLLGFFTVFGIGILVYLRNRKSVVNNAWAMLCINASFWSVFYFLAINSDNKQASFIILKFVEISGMLVAFLWLRFIIVFLELQKLSRIKLIFNIVLILSSIIFLLNFTPLYIKDLTSKSIFQYYIVPGIGYYLFAIYFSLIVLYGLNLLSREYKKTTAFKANQIKYIFLASVMGFTGGGSTFLLSFNINFPPYPLILFTTFPLIISYAILKYRLMDIRVAISRTGTFIAVYTIVLGLPFALVVWFRTWLITNLGTRWWIAPLGLMAGLATVGPFIYIYLERKAEARLLREQKRYQDVLKQASVGMTRIRNLRKLLDLITHIVTKTVKISYAAIYLYNQESDEYMLQVSRDKGRIPIPKLSSDNPLVNWIVFRRQPLIYDEIKRKMLDTNDITYAHLEENMRLLTATVIIPSFLEDKFIGFVVLGDKMSGEIYTHDDLNVFQVLASQAALAIENAQFYEETKEMQEQVAQAEKMATIGTMADGLSHQINNRFYALSLIAGDTIDTIKLTDTANCTPEVREMIKSVGHALERIQANVMQGGEVVKGMLKYTRKGEDNFGELTIDQILDATLDMIQFKIKLSEIDIIRNYSKDTPKIKGNLVQLQEAFFNFIDNAYDATNERKAALNEPNYRGRLTISAKPKDDFLEMIIEDNGMGVKEDNIKKVFTPFFTTKTSSRKGTGLGLYVIKKIITDTHKGRIAFESSYKVGTRFILELPIATAE
jgi:signal transduction histidine kinase